MHPQQHRRHPHYRRHACPIQELLLLLPHGGNMTGVHVTGVHSQAGRNNIAVINCESLGGTILINPYVIPNSVVHNLEYDKTQLREYHDTFRVMQ